MSKFFKLNPVNPVVLFGLLRPKDKECGPFELDDRMQGILERHRLREVNADGSDIVVELSERERLEAKNATELKDLLRNVGLKVGGTKPELVERILEHNASLEDDGEPETDPETDPSSEEE